MTSADTLLKSSTIVCRPKEHCNFEIRNIFAKPSPLASMQIWQSSTYSNFLSILLHFWSLYDSHHEMLLIWY